MSLCLAGDVAGEGSLVVVYTEDFTGRNHKSGVAGKGSLLML